MKKLIISLSLVLLASPAFSATYYIDYVGGSDSNNGTAKETPWKLAPGMQGCLITDTNNNNCRARTHASTAGDTFVFKGGVTWPAAALSFDWYFGNTTTFTVDATWYTGASWARPIFDNEGAETTASPEGTTHMMRAYGTDQVINNIEFKGAAQLHGGENGYGSGMLKIGTSGAAGGEVKNCYFHGWVHGGTATADNSVILESAAVSEGPDINLKIHDNVFDGSDSTNGGDSNRAYRGSAGHFYNNYVAYVPNGTCCYLNGYVWGNTFFHIGDNTVNTSCPGFATYPSFDCGMHMQCYEAYGGGDTYYYNNLMKNVAGGATVILYPNNNASIYVFNNVDYSDINQTLQLSSDNMGASNTSNVFVWNNTFQSTSATAIVSGGVGTNTFNAGRVQNNHLIGLEDEVSLLATTLTEDHNIEDTLAQTTSAGYSSASSFTPPNGSAITVGTGADLSAVCAALTDSSPSAPTTACASDTALGVSYNATTHTVTGVGRTAIERGATWDIGAYEYAEGGVVNGVCGSANTGYYADAPTLNLCTAGTASAVTGSYAWSCDGSGGGTNANCTASPVSVSANKTAGRYATTQTVTLTGNADHFLYYYGDSATGTPATTYTVPIATILMNYDGTQKYLRIQAVDVEDNAGAITTIGPLKKQRRK